MRTGVALGRTARTPYWRIRVAAAPLVIGVMLSGGVADAACRWNEGGVRPGISCLPGPARLAPPEPRPSQPPTIPAPEAPQRAAPQPQAAPLPFPRPAPVGRSGALRPPAASIPPSLPGGR